MPQSLSKVYVHITFSTKNRVNRIDDKIETPLFEYIGGVCKQMECNPIKVGGHENHIHILCLLSRKIAQMTLLENIKKSFKNNNIKYFVKKEEINYKIGDTVFLKLEKINFIKGNALFSII